MTGGSRHRGTQPLRAKLFLTLCGEVELHDSLTVMTERARSKVRLVAAESTFSKGLLRVGSQISIGEMVRQISHFTEEAENQIVLHVGCKGP